jgi:hypothetical protein
MAPLHEIICPGFSFAAEFCARPRSTPRFAFSTLIRQIRGSSTPELT